MDARRTPRVLPAGRTAQPMVVPLASGTTQQTPRPAPEGRLTARGMKPTEIGSYARFFIGSLANILNFPVRLKGKCPWGIPRGQLLFPASLVFIPVQLCKTLNQPIYR